MLRCKVMVLRQVLRGASELQKVRVECWHFRCNMVEKECLDQVRPMNFQWYLQEEVVHIQIVLSNDINNQLVFYWLLGIELQCADSIL